MSCLVSAFSKQMIPNYLSGFRFISGPFIVYFFHQQNFPLAIGLMSIAGFTDWLDGFTARLLRCESSFGKIFDPIADKALVLTLFLYMMLTQPFFFTLAWCVIGRDLAILAGAYFLSKKRNVKSLPPLLISKINTFMVLMLMLVVMLISWHSTHLLGQVYSLLDIADVFKPTLLLQSLEAFSFSYRLVYITVLLLFYGSYLTTLLSGIGYVHIFFAHYRTS